MTKEVIRAFNHVKEFFPDVAIVIYSKDLYWCYMDRDFNVFSFTGKDINISILEEALDSIPDLPYIYQPN
jgi:hypothetical protein